jgi:hypothetical protein
VRERLLERLAGRTRVSPDEHPRVSADPEGRRLPEALDELLGQELAHDAPNAVRAEIPPHSGQTVTVRRGGAALPRRELLRV